MNRAPVFLPSFPRVLLLPPLLLLLQIHVRALSRTIYPIVTWQLHSQVRPYILHRACGSAVTPPLCCKWPRASLPSCIALVQLSLLSSCSVCLHHLVLPPPTH